MTLLTLALVMAVGLGAAIQLLRYKNRLVWQKLWELDARNENLENALVSVRKQQLLARIPNLRLPPRAPSQHGEELVIWEFFAGQRCGFFVEIGAYDGVTFSNTYLLEAAGWNGILVEANPRRFQECRKERPYSHCVQAAVVANRAYGAVKLMVPVGEDGIDSLSYIQTTSEHRQRVSKAARVVDAIDIPSLTMDELLEGHNGSVQLVSIDVEGAELSVLQGMNIARWLPELLIIEDNTMGKDPSIRNYLNRFGYVERLRIKQNVFLTRADDNRPLRRF